VLAKIAARNQDAKFGKGGAVYMVATSSTIEFRIVGAGRIRDSKCSVAPLRPILMCTSKDSYIQKKSMKKSKIKIALES
jgi:hypothetical protein